MLSKRQPLTVPASVSLSLPAADSHCSSLTWKRSHSCLSSDSIAPTFPQRFPIQSPTHRRRVCLQLAQMSLACFVCAEFKERETKKRSQNAFAAESSSMSSTTACRECERRAVVALHHRLYLHSLSRFGTVLKGTQVEWGWRVGGWWFTERGRGIGSVCVSGLSYVRPSCPPGRQLCIVMYSSDILSCCLQAWAAFISMSSQPAVSWQLSLEPRGFYLQKFTANAAERDGRTGLSALSGPPFPSIIDQR